MKQAYIISLAVLFSCAIEITHGAGYSSLVRPLVKSVYWQVTNAACTSVHSLNISTGALAWKRVGQDQTWPMQVTDKRAFYSLQTGGPATFAITLDKGNVKWVWPNRAGFAFWRHWVIDLPQDAQLLAAVPVPQAELVLMRSHAPGGKLYGLNISTGALVWEWDSVKDVTAAAAAAGLPAPTAEQGSLLVEMTALTPAPSSMVVYVTLSMAVPQPLNTSFHGQMDPAGNEVSSAHFSTDPTTVFKPKPKPATKRVGWVYAVDLATGTVLWGTGPVARGVASVVSTDKVVLVASKAASNGTGTLMGVDKGNGMVAYTFTCVVGPCKAMPASTKLGIHYSSLARPDNTSLSGLSVFELSTGAVLWQGVPDAQETLAVNGTCTDIAVPRGDMHFACTCLQTLPPDTPAMASSIGSGSLTRVKTALCAYTIAVESGKLRYELVVSPADAAPTGASSFGLAPMVLADKVVYPGQHGVYGVTTASPPPPAAGSTENTGEGTARALLASAPAHTDTASIKAQIEAARSKGRLEIVVPKGSSEMKAGAAARLLFSFPLPTGLVFRAWDWMELKDGLLMLHVSPDVGKSRPPPVKRKDDKNAAGHVAYIMPEPMVEEDSGEEEEFGEENPWQPAMQLTKPRALISSAVAAGALGTHGSAVAAVLAARLTAEEGEGRGGRLGKKRPNKNRYMESRVYALNPATGSVKWQHTYNSSLFPMANHTQAHAFGRAGLLLVDGCRPPRALGGEHHMKAGAEGVGEGDSDEDFRGTSCCLYALSMSSGAVKWRHCFDLDHECASGIAQNTATTIVYVLLMLQACLLAIGFGSTAVWRFCCRKRYLAPASAYTQAPVVEVLAHDVASEESD